VSFAVLRYLPKVFKNFEVLAWAMEGVPNLVPGM